MLKKKLFDLKSKMAAYTRKQWIFVLCGILLTVALFGFYAVNRQEYVGASDFYGYYAGAQQIKAGSIFLKTKLDPIQYPCVAPLGYHTVNGKITPQYPPGYPLIMALASYAGLEFFVSPIIGALSVVLMFFLLNELTGDKRIAAFFALIWGISPIVVWGSIYVMSDLAATFFVLLAYYLFIRDKAGASAISAGFSLVIRPTSALFLVAFFPLVVIRKKWLRFGLFFLMPAILYGLYNLYVYGAPWRTGYLKISTDLLPEVFFPHLLFYLQETLVQFTPLLLLLALAALWKRVPGSWFYAGWFLLFLIFYSFWKSGGDVWWWTRFLLPAFPALFILAALGTKEITTRLQKNPKIPPQAIPIIMGILVVAYLFYFIAFERKQMMFNSKNETEGYYYVSREIAAKVPPGSVIGALELSGPLRTYFGLETFLWCDTDSCHLIRDLLQKKIPIFLAVERWNWNHPSLLMIQDKFKYRMVENINDYDSWLLEKGKWLLQITHVRYKKRLNTPSPTQ